MKTRSGEKEGHFNIIPLPSLNSDFKKEAINHDHLLEEINGSDYHIDDHLISTEELLNRYGSDIHKGLNENQIILNREIYGRNILTPPPKPSNIWKFTKCVWGGLNFLLWVCAILAFVCYGIQYLYTTEILNDNLILGVSLVVVVHFSGAFEFYQEFSSNRIMESFKNMVPKFTIVFRNGKREELSVPDLVMGDIVEIKYGDMIPADVRIIECQNFKVDNSSLTGESEPVKRSAKCSHICPMDTANMAYFTTCAVEGYAKAIVVRVGSSTFMGRLANLASSIDSSKSPIRKEMDRFVSIMTVRSILFGGLFLGIALGMGYSWTDSVFFVIGIVVANIPEGLSITFTMILSLTAKKMAKKSCLVKHLHSVEALGSTSVICTDKTGTLTQNKMTVAHLWFNNEIVDVDTSENARNLKYIKTTFSGFNELAEVAKLCSKAKFKPDQDNVPIQQRIIEGDATEAAILRCMELNFNNITDYRDQFPKIFEVPFNSANKFQVSIHNLNEEDKRLYLAMKGAPERIVKYCTKILIGNTEYDFDSKWQKLFEETCQKLGEYGERVLGFCDCRLSLEKYPQNYKFDPENLDFLKEADLRFVGLISMKDPPRSSVPNAIAKCRTAGIKVVMVTGDHPITARAIAKCVGIISQDNKIEENIGIKIAKSIENFKNINSKAVVITGDELKLLNLEELECVIGKFDEIVFARTSPEQKYKIVEAFQNLGHIVSLTGDGVNDSPALKKADIGIAMGLTGTEVSKEAADMILMDDNFATIVIGVEEGRLIFDNLKKLLIYTMGDNVAEMYLVWIFIILRIPLPMGSTAMLLSALATDLFPAISIAFEKAENDIMKLKPRNPKTQQLVTPQLLSYTYGQTAWIETAAGFFTWFVCLGYYGWLPDRLIGIVSNWSNSEINDLQDSFGQEWTFYSRRELELTAQSSFFVAIVLAQVANVLINKVQRNSVFIQKMNWRMNIAIVIELAFLYLFVYTPDLNFALDLRNVPWILWATPIPFAILLFVYDELRRLVVRNTRPDGFIHNEFCT